MRVVVLAVMCALSACYSSKITSCPDVDCPSNKVCDGQGGCAFRAQLDSCSGAADGASCSYPDSAGKTIDSAHFP